MGGLHLLLPAGGTSKGPIQATKTQPFLKGFLSTSHTWIPSVSHQPQVWLLLLQPPALKGANDVEKLVQGHSVSQEQRGAMSGALRPASWETCVRTSSKTRFGCWGAG